MVFVVPKRERHTGGLLTGIPYDEELSVQAVLCFRRSLSLGCGEEAFQLGCGGNGPTPSAMLG